MPAFLRTALRYVRAFLLILIFLWCGNALAALLPIVLPGSIIGMVLLFVALSLRWLPESWVAPGCQWFLTWMALFFVPVSVGLMNYYALVVAQFVPIVLSSVGSTLLVLLVVAAGTQWQMKKHRGGAEKND